MANHAKPARQAEFQANIQSTPNQEPKPERHEWFSIVKLADNDYRVVSFWAPLPEKYAKGPKMVVPGEMVDRWNIDCASLMDRWEDDC